MTTALVRRAGAITIIAATAAALTGCGGGIGARLTFADTEKVKVTEIVLSGGSGDVTVSTSATSQTSINRVIHHGSDPGKSYRIEGTVLTVDTDCGPACTVSYDIQAPTGVTVRGELGSGAVHLTGVGGADVRVRSGSVQVRDATGPVTARATSGDIDVAGVAGATTLEVTSGDVRASRLAGAVDARTTSGDMDIKLTTPASVKAEVTSGDLNLTVPAGAYAVHDDTGSGDLELLGVTDTAGSPNVLTLKASSGDITVTGR